MSQARVLLVDDDPDFLIIYRTYLEAAGYEVETAASAAEGLTRALAHPPDVAVVDLMMEEMDSGVGLAHEFSRQPALAQVPVVIVTGVREETGFDFTLRTEEERQWLRVREWVEKPITRERLVAVIARLLEEKGGTGEPGAGG